MDALRDEVDLIKLDTSIELEDFDPLNQNAKPIPSLPARTNGGVASNSSAISSGCFNNPLYPYFEPPFMSPVPAGGNAGLSQGSSDAELLRKYGLDQLTMEKGEAIGGAGMGTRQKTPTTTTNIMMGTASEASNRPNWTTFE